MAEWLAGALKPGGDEIVLKGARTHNLKAVSCTFPHGKMTVVTGVSGSGKSSLAFDTVFAEGQRRYVETLSSYVRQFIPQMPRPPVDSLTSLQPSIALKQGKSATGPRTTFADLTELSDHMQVLFAGAGQLICPSCGGLVKHMPVEEARQAIIERADDTRIVVLGSLRIDPEQGAATMLRLLASQGHRRLWHKGELLEIDGPETAALLKAKRIQVVIDRLKVDREDTRLLEALEAAYAFGEGTAEVILWDEEDKKGKRPTIVYDPRHSCNKCGESYPEPSPQLFSPSSILGQCRACRGAGTSFSIDPNKLIADPNSPLEDKVFVPLGNRAMDKEARRDLVHNAMRSAIPIDIPWRDLLPEHQAMILKGFGNWDGIYSYINRIATSSIEARLLAREKYYGYTECKACEGSGLSPLALAVRVADTSYASLLQSSVEDALAWVGGLNDTLDEELQLVMAPVIKELASRLEFLCDVGVGYITLRRKARTLSGGEQHRALLATNVGRRLSDTCYVLDEPTAGLHPDDTDRLMRVIEALRDEGNTLIVVEHDPDVIARADKIIELGPLGGEAGGRLLFEGSVADLRESETPSGTMLQARESATFRRRQAQHGWIELRHANANNLRDVEARFQRAALNVVTGVSGSGKSTLVIDLLYPMIAGQQLGEGGIATLSGGDFSEVQLIGQDTIRRSSRSSIVTASGVLDRLRAGLAKEREAVERRLTAASFSFNSSTQPGRCPHCAGLGYRKVEMHFMADVEITCEVCDGARFSSDVLEVRYMGYNISEYLNMSVDFALEHFRCDPHIPKLLQPYHDVGLGYVALGQATAHLSGGEAQRMMLAPLLALNQEGAQSADNGRLVIMDEPTTGLHMRDIAILLRSLHKLADQGATLIIIEHNMDLIAAADHIVDLGPGAGPRGGLVVAQGTPEYVATIEGSKTGSHLRQLVIN